ncbi:hypothetical protein IG631_04513 [Alternaria alternata]|nr:hypothetical protein IG631_04513 [Alternaria alternata]
MRCNWGMGRHCDIKVKLGRRLPRSCAHAGLLQQPRPLRRPDPLEVYEGLARLDSSKSLQSSSQAAIAPTNPRSTIILGTSVQMVETGPASWRKLDSACALHA